MQTLKSAAWFDQAQKYLPGGVNSPVRAFGSVGGHPRFMARGKGSRIWDEDGNEYIDLVCSWGPLLLGHAHPVILEALEEAMELGTSFGAPTAREVELARLICEYFPSIEKVRMTSSGTEAAATAIRLARGFTRRELVVKFAGCYHGHVDSMLVEAGSGALTQGEPNSAGVLRSTAAATIVLPYNDSNAVERLLESRGSEIAAVFVEPIAGNMGLVNPEPDFLARIRKACDRSQSLLVFDEVISGFRVARGGAQQKYQLRADLTILGKIIGGGLPVGAIGGRKDIMDSLAPLGPVYQAGTLSGNPLAVTAGIAMLRALRSEKVYETLEARGAQLGDGLAALAREYRVPMTVNRAGSLLSIFFTDRPVRNLDEVMATDKARYSPFFWSMLDKGVYLPPSAFEAFFLSTAHSTEDVQRVLQAAEMTFRSLSKGKH